MRPPGLTSLEGTPARATGNHCSPEWRVMCREWQLSHCMYEPLSALCGGRGAGEEQGWGACVTIISYLTETLDLNTWTLDGQPPWVLGSWGRYDFRVWW